MKGKKVIVISVAVICAAAIGGYEYWKYEDTRKREAAYQAAKDSLILELQTDPTIESKPLMIRNNWQCPMSKIPMEM